MKAKITLQRFYSRVLKEHSGFLRRIWVRLTSKARRTARKTGRNDPCPCGSGKKYKRCCGRAN